MPANAGMVTLLGSASGSTLRVTGNYVGHNGLLNLGTMLGDSSSISDRLVASASGTTTVQITNMGGLGARTSGDGIEVISAITARPPPLRPPETPSAWPTVMWMRGLTNTVCMPPMPAAVARTGTCGRA